MPDIELRICRRLRQFRENSKLSQVSFAKEIGLDGRQLGNYEYGRAPIRFGLVESICSRFSLNIRWLAEGIGDPSGNVLLVEDLDIDVPPKTLLSDVYFERIKPHLERCIDLGADLFGVPRQKLSAPQVRMILSHAHNINELAVAIFIQRFHAEKVSALRDLPLPMYKELYTMISRAFDDFKRNNADKVAAYRGSK